MNKKATVIYHSADFDGIFCREIAKRFLGPGTADSPNQFIGWNFGEPPIQPIGEGPIYILDLWPECVANFNGWQERIIWIDHHKSSIEKWPASIPGYRIDGVAACRLAWQWFVSQNGSQRGVLPVKANFVNREVAEPLAVRLAGEYDVWDKRDPNADTLQYGLRSQDEVPFSLLLEESERGKEMTHQVISDGQAAQRYAQKTDADIVNHRSYITVWEGLKFLTMNALRCNSLSFAAKDVPETGHEALLAYNYNGKCWTVSLYHARHRTDLDLSAIAVKHGGGGHRGACGFTCQNLPFMP